MYCIKIALRRSFFEKTAQSIANAEGLEALGFDKDTAEGAISILTELGIISCSDTRIKYPI